MLSLWAPEVWVRRDAVATHHSKGSLSLSAAETAAATTRPAAVAFPLLVVLAEACPAVVGAAARALLVKALLVAAAICVLGITRLAASLAVVAPVAPGRARTHHLLEAETAVPAFASTLRARLPVTEAAAAGALVSTTEPAAMCALVARTVPRAQAALGVVVPELSTTPLAAW